MKREYLSDRARAILNAACGGWKNDSGANRELGEFVSRLEAVASAARAVYEEDDAYTIGAAIGKQERDKALGAALSALDGDDAAGGK